MRLLGDRRTHPPRLAQEPRRCFDLLVVAAQREDLASVEVNGLRPPTRGAVVVPLNDMTRPARVVASETLPGRFGGMEDAEAGRTVLHMERARQEPGCYAVQRDRVVERPLAAATQRTAP